MTFGEVEANNDTLVESTFIDAPCWEFLQKKGKKILSILEKL